MAAHRPDPAAMAFRAQALGRIRAHFSERAVLEVDTPALSRGISLDCHIDVFSAPFHPLGYARPEADSLPETDPPTRSGQPYFLQTSPEPHMKRLLCHGFPDIYQVAKAFRNGERGQNHNPEFTMLEWYRKGFTLERLMDEVETVCALVAGPRPCVRRTYREVFRTAMDADPLGLDLDGLLALPALTGRLPARDAFPAKSDALDFIMAHLIEPAFPPETLTFVHGFPAEQAAQAQVYAEEPRLAHRFEVYGGGMELGNGYLELTDADEYERRFDAENARRRLRGKPELPKDGNLLADLRLGLPPCAGVAMGFDRLLMLGLERAGIDSVMAFPWDFC